MEKNTILNENLDPENFENLLHEIQQKPPLIGTASLMGESPNVYLHKAWEVLHNNGIDLKRGVLNYRWHTLQKMHPKLAYSVEEVLIFGDALFTKIAEKQSPDSLKNDFNDIKQRYAKIIKTTENLSSPQDDKSVFSLFKKEKNENQNDIKLVELDHLLEEAHEKSRELLDKTEKDLNIEKAFDEAVNWFIVALENIQTHLISQKEQGYLKMSDMEITEIKNALNVAEMTTRANMAASAKFLQVKENLHNKSITFLTSHENTFTVIQSHLRTWKDIQQQTQTLNSLSETVKMGSKLLSQASIGVEGAFKNFDTSFISMNTIASLQKSFNHYDNDITDLISSLNILPTTSSSISFSRWDDWDKNKKELIEPILNEKLEKTENEMAYRPVRRSSDTFSKDIPENSKKDKVKKTAVLRELEFTKQPWTFLEKMKVQQKIDLYNQFLDENFSFETIEQLNWTPAEALFRLSGPLQYILKQNLPTVVRGQMDFHTKFSSSAYIDWEKIVEQKILLPYQKEWKNEFKEWMATKNDFVWFNIMEWNELIYDLLIFEQDPEQKNNVFQEKTEKDTFIKKGVVNRIENFIESSDQIDHLTIQEWGMYSLIIKYACELEMDYSKIKKLWNIWPNPLDPIDFEGNSIQEKWTFPFYENIYQNIFNDFFAQNNKMENFFIQQNILKSSTEDNQNESQHQKLKKKYNKL